MLVKSIRDKVSGKVEKVERNRKNFKKQNFSAKSRRGNSFSQLINIFILIVFFPTDTVRKMKYK